MTFSEPATARLPAGRFGCIHFICVITPPLPLPPLRMILQRWVSHDRARWSRVLICDHFGFCFWGAKDRHAPRSEPWSGLGLPTPQHGPLSRNRDTKNSSTCYDHPSRYEEFINSTQIASWRILAHLSKNCRGVAPLAKMAAALPGRLPGRSR